MTKSALELAESSEWAALLRMLDAQSEAAEQLDDFGMMVLHWSCTDAHVPLRIVKKLVESYPPAVQHKNKGGLLPLHIAIKARAKLEVLQTLANADDSCVGEETPSGETPSELAQKYSLSPAIVSYLQTIEDKLRDDGRMSNRPSWRMQSMMLNLPTGPEKTPEVRQTPAVQASTPLPPRWRRDKTCNICQLKFNYFKTRHHCRNCGESVCSTHSNRKLPLQHMALRTPQRVCILCYDELNEHGATSAVVNLYPNGTEGHAKPHSMSFESKLRPTISTNSMHSTSTANSSAQSISLLRRQESSPVLHPDQSVQSPEELNKYGEMQEQVNELQAHVDQLMATKKRIEKALADTGEQREKSTSVAEGDVLKKGRLLDLSNLRVNRLGRATSRSADESESGSAKENRDEASVYKGFGVSLLDQGDINGAAAEFRKSVAANRNDSEVWFNLARALYAQGEHVDAEVAIRQAIEMSERSYAAVTLLGKILYSRGDHDASAEAFKEALGLMNDEEESDSDEDVGSTTVGW